MRRTDLLFHAGGECLQQYGTLVRRLSRDTDNGYTHTRSGAVGKYVAADGTLLDAAANIPRVDWIDTDADDTHDTPTLLLEAARTNLVTTDDITAWTTIGTPVVTGSVSDPAGGTGAYSVEDNDGASVEAIERVVTFTGDDVKSAVFVVKEGTAPATGTGLRIRDNSAAADRLFLDITAWSGGEPTVSATTGTLLGKRYIGNGYWAIYAQTTSVTAANSHEIGIIPAHTNIADTGVINVFRVNAYDATVPPVSILDASEVKNTDEMYADFLSPPQAMTVYLKFVERGSISMANNVGLVHIGSGTASADPRFAIYVSSNKYAVVHDNGTTSPGAVLTAAPTWGDTVELRGVLNADGSVTIGQSVNAAAETTASTATTAVLGSAWAGTRFYMGTLGTSQKWVGAFESVKVARGVRSMSEMRAL